MYTGTYVGYYFSLLGALHPTPNSYPIYAFLLGPLE